VGGEWCSLGKRVKGEELLIKGNATADEMKAPLLAS